MASLGRERRKSRGVVSYSESPIESPKPNTRNSVRTHSPEIETKAKTPKTSRKFTRNASQDRDNFSPKKLRTNRTPSSKALESIVIDDSPTVQQYDTPRRRSSREKKPNTSHQDLFESLTKLHTSKKGTPRKSLAKTKKAADTKPAEVEVEESDESIEVIELEDNSDPEIEKPSAPFDEDEDVEGQKVYSFKTPKKKDSMAAFAQRTPKTPSRATPKSKATPKTPKTPKNQRISEIQKTPTSRPSALMTVKTPSHFRAQTKQRLVKKVLELEEDEEECSGSDSDFENKENDETSSSEASSNDEDSPERKPLPLASRVLKTPSTANHATPSTRRRGRNGDEMVLKSDNYFSSAASKTKTSNNTLDSLKNPRLPHDELVKLLSKMELSKEHAEAVKDINEEHKTNFDKWMTLFDEGYTVLLHGFGSKRNLLHAFHQDRLAKEHVLVVNGFFPSLTIKDIIDNIWVDLLENTSVGGNPHEIVNMIEKEFNDIPALHFFLIIHNIDGPMLRNEKAQSVLSHLATIKNIHMIVSIDHINAPLLWNNTKLSNYNFIWFDVTSFLPYTEETAFDNSLLVQNSGALELSSMKNVFQSLTPNARGIYILLVKYQLKNHKNPSYQGMAFKELYSACRDGFFVSNDVALRAQLTEFLDHKLAKSKRTIDGAESITIPIRNHLLEQFLNEQNKN